MFARIPNWLLISIVIHLLALGMGVVLGWTLTIGIVFLNHFILSLISLWPRSNLLGINWSRLPNTRNESAIPTRAIALTIDDGPDPLVTPLVLKILIQYQVKATFFCIGEKVLLYPDLCQQIIEAGHSIENHSQNHKHTFSLFGIGRLKAEIALAQQSIYAITKRRPLYFRAPAGLRNPLLDSVLNSFNLQLVSWTRRGFDTRQSDSSKVFKRIIRSGVGLRDGDIILLHDGNATIDKSNNKAVILNVLPQLIECANQTNLSFVRLDQIIPKPPNLIMHFSDHLIEQACQSYLLGGRFAYHFAKGKMSQDPAFMHILSEGYVGEQARVLDLGCGQGLLASLLEASHKIHFTHDWPTGWVSPIQSFTYTGIDLMPNDVYRANAALSKLNNPSKAIAGDICSTPFPDCDVVIVLDVLHYIKYDNQIQVLQRIHQALSKNGQLLLRIGDAGAGLPFKISNWVDAVVTTIRGHRLSRLYCRTLKDWITLLERMGFTVAVKPMSQGTLFANILLVAKKTEPTDSL